MKVAFIGAGKMTSEHLKVYAGIKGVKIAGLCNRTLEKAEILAKEFNIPTVTCEIGELWEKTKADLVVMSVYEPAILETYKKCAKYDWAIQMEKPMGMNPQESREIAAVAADREKPTFVGLNRRALGATRKASESLDANSESARFIYIQDQQSLLTARAIGHSEAVVKNWMYANSIHLVDYLRNFGRGQIETVTVLERWDEDNPQRVVAHIRFNSGDTGIYEANWNGPGPWACTVATDVKRWELRPLEKASFQNAGERHLHEVDPDPLDMAFKPGFFHQALQIIAAVEGRRSNAVTAECALESVELLEQIYAQNPYDYSSD